MAEGRGKSSTSTAPSEVGLRGRVWGVVPMQRAELVVDGEVVRTWRTSPATASPWT